MELGDMAAQHIPERTSSNFRGESIYSPNPMIYMESADGVELTDVDGNEYLDFFCGVSAIIMGHAPPRQVEMVRDQLERGTYFGTTHEHEPIAAELMTELVPGAEQVKFINTGTEAVMSALRIARAYTGKEKILKFEGMYHGHNDESMISVKPGAASLGGRRNPNKIPNTNGIPKTTLDGVDTLPFNDPELLAEKLERDGDDIAAVITEGVMSNCGLIWPSAGYLSTLREVTRDHDVLLILDEVVTGFRMGLGGAQEYFDITPDLAIFGKAMANGYPNAAVTGRREIMQTIRPDSEGVAFSGTFSGNPLVVAATRANLEGLRDLGTDGYRRFYATGDRLVDGLREICRDAGHSVFVPDFAGFTYLHFTDGESDPDDWRDWRDVSRHTDGAKYETFARAMIGEGVFFVPRVGRINLTHAHEPTHVDQALEAAKSAIGHVS